MTIQLYYKTKKDLKNNIGSELDYSETNMFKDEYKADGVVIGCDVIVNGSQKLQLKIT